MELRTDKFRIKGWMNEWIQACKRTSMDVRMNGRMGNIDGHGIDGMGEGGSEELGKREGERGEGNKEKRGKRREGGREALHLFSNFLLY